MYNSGLIDFCYHLESTYFSRALQDNFWVVPTMQSLHILAIASVLIATLLINLRILGLYGKSESVVVIIVRYNPLVWAALPILFITGCIMIISEPARSLTNPIFQIKMVMLVLVILITLIYQRKYCSNTPSEQVNTKTRLLAILSLGLWSGIVAAGRWIAYS